MPRLSPEKMAALRRQFQKYNTSGDGTLSLKEMSVLLRRGHPGMSEEEVRHLFQAVDTNHDGRVDFGEFVEFVYSPPDESVPQDVKDMFSAFCDGGPTMDGPTFAKLCKDCGLLGHKLETKDVDIIFHAVKPKGERSIAFMHFSRALRKVAEIKGIPVEEVFATVGDAEGPRWEATKPDAVRFHDDKELYTGTHRAVSPDVDLMADFPRGSASGAGLRVKKRSSALRSASPLPADDTDWSQVEPIYHEYCHHKDDRLDRMDGYAFAKLCRDAQLCDENFHPSEVDVIYATICGGKERQIDFAQFVEALRLVVARKGCAPYFVLKEVIAAKGPVHSLHH